MPLTPHQQEKFDEVFTLLRAGKKRIRLQGSAGVGKTVLASELVKAFKRDYTINTEYNNGCVFVTAPTNKALAVLQSKVTTPVEFKTIHSALKLRRNVNKATGTVTFIKAWSRQDDFKKCKIAIIDEASMLNTDIEGGNIEVAPGRFEYKKGYLDGYGFPIIYIGDNKQLNPVGEAESAVFMKDYPVVELTEIIRQGEGNPIIDLSRDIDLIHFKEPCLVNGKGYVYDNNVDGIVESLSEVNGTDEMKYLAFTNAAVDAINLAVRKRIYGEAPKKIELSETIVFNSPYESFYTNKEVKIEQVDIITKNVPVPRMNTKYDEMNKPVNDVDYIRMKYYRVNGAFSVVHEESMSIYTSIAKTLAYNCSKLGWNWKGKYFFEEQFADITYNHAITIHKSQGSTYKQSVINIGDVMINRNNKEKARLLYTAITRASDLVILNNVK